MQHKRSEYNPELHDKFRALTVKNPYATYLVTPGFRELDVIFGQKSIEVRSRNTSYRGDLLICSSASPDIPGMLSGVTLGFVELYDVKPIEEFTEFDWVQTRISPERREQIKTGYGWMMRNPRRVIEFPVRGQLGLYNLIYDKDMIVEYPRALVMDRESYLLANKMAHEKN